MLSGLRPFVLVINNRALTRGECIAGLSDRVRTGDGNTNDEEDEEDDDEEMKGDGDEGEGMAENDVGEGIPTVRGCGGNEDALKCFVMEFTVQSKIHCNTSFPVGNDARRMLETASTICFLSARSSQEYGPSS